MLFDCEIAQDNTTRADESGFADGDRMGVFVVNYRDGSPSQLTLSGNQANNVALTFDYDANKWNAATDIYWLDKTTPADIYGYYPFFNGLSSVTDYSFEVNADQSRPAADGDICSYEASDFLWAKAEKATPGQKVNLTYTHRMAGVKVVLQEGSGFADGQWAKVSKLVTVDNTTRHSTIDLQTGVVTATGGFDRNIVMNDDATGWRAVVVPQTVAAGKTTIGITIDGKPFAYTRDGGMKYTAGKMHTFTIKVDYNEGSGAYSLSLTSEDITDWESDNTSHDFVENSFVVVECPEAGGLREALNSKHIDFNTIRNLKINGVLTTEDFYLMRDELISLTALNLRDVKIVNVTYWEYGDNGIGEGEFTEDDFIPSEAFRDKQTLRRIILPERLIKIGNYAFSDIALNTTLTIPESVTHLMPYAFAFIHEGCAIVMPHHLEYIGHDAFYENKADIELVLTNTIHYIGSSAFWGAEHTHGTLSVPSNLEYLGAGALPLGDRVDGEIVIPPTITEIPGAAFRGVNMKGGTKVTFHDGISKIGGSAFEGISFAPGFRLPKNLKEIEGGAFSGCIFPEDLEIPESVHYIGEGAFAFSNLKGSLKIPDAIEMVSPTPLNDWLWGAGSFAFTQIEDVKIGNNVEIIGGGAFQGNQFLKTVEIGKNVERIGIGAFEDCPEMRTVICLAKEPPKLYGNVFDGSDLLHCHLEVPEESVELYKSAEGWKDIQFISPHRELTVGIHDQSCLNKGMSRSVILYSEGKWRVKSSPSWIHVTPDHGDYKSEITFVIDPLASGSGNREGNVIFELIDKDYTSECGFRQFDYAYAEDTEIILQSASAQGNPINLFIVGDGFGADEIVSGRYMELMNQTMDQFFDIEPYKTYRKHFNVSTSIAMSPDNGSATLQNNKTSRLNTYGVDLDVPVVRNYAVSVSDAITPSNISDATIIVVSNLDAFIGDSYIEHDGCALSCISISDDPYPYDQRGLVQHYAGGQAFAGLATEYVTHCEHINGCTCPKCNDLPKYYAMKEMGLYENVTLSGKMNDSPWSMFIFHPRYGAMVDMWEGGFRHLLGVWRSESQSVMGTYVAYYNTISRYAIYKAIMRRAGLTYSLDEFIEKDKIELP